MFLVLKNVFYVKVRKFVTLKDYALGFVSYEIVNETLKTSEHYFIESKNYFGLLYHIKIQYLEGLNL